MGRVVRIALGVGLLFVPGLQGAGAAILLGEAATILGPKPPKNTINPQTITARSANMPGQIVYGRTRTSGMLYIPTPGSSGPGRKYLHYIVVLACHELDEIGDIWLDTDKVESADIGVDGIVTAGRFEGKLLIEKFLGTDDQVASTVLTAAIPGWDANFRGRGIAYIHLRMERDDEVFRGPPNNIYAEVQGRKVYDPRTGVTAFSANAALCVRDYLVEYVGAPVDETLASAAANICDESMTVPGRVQPGFIVPDVVQIRYACAGVLSTGEEPRNNIESLLSAMNGASTFIGGEFQVYAGAYDAPLHTVDASWLAGAVEAQLHSPASKTYNVVRGAYIDPERNWQEVEHEIQTVGSYVTQDGRRLELERAYPFTPNEYQAQRQSYQYLLQSRGQRTIQLQLNLRGLNVKAWQTVDLDLPEYGLSGVYRVTEWQYGEQSPVRVTLSEESSGFYATPTYLTPQVVTVVGTQTESPSAPNNLSIVRVTDGNVISWTNPPSRQFSEIVINRGLLDDFSLSTEIARVRSTSYLDVTPTAYFYWIRAFNGSTYSETLPPSGGAQGGGVDPGGALNATLSSTTIHTAVQNGSSWPSAPVTCHVTGGTAPYTYLWERVSGSTDVTATDATAAVTRFACVTGTNQSKQAAFRCVVTDSSSPAGTANSPNVIAYFAFLNLSSGDGDDGGWIEP